jgi:hypothetical protein
MGGGAFQDDELFSLVQEGLCSFWHCSVSIDRAYDY